MRPKILLDIDGCLANFCKSYLQFLNGNYDCTFDVNEEPTEYNMSVWGHGVESLDLGDVSRKYILSGGFKNIELFPGARDFLFNLITFCDAYIVTARIGAWDTVMSKKVCNIIERDTYNWFRDNAMETDHIYFVNDKIPFCLNNNINIMVEDKFKTAELASKRGIHTVLIDRRYNQSPKDDLNIHRAYSFDEAIKTIKGLI